MALVIDPNRFVKRVIKKQKHKLLRLWTKLSTKDGNLYMIDDKMYQTFDGKYKYIGRVCDMYEGDFNIIPKHDIINH